MGSVFPAINLHNAMLGYLQVVQDFYLFHRGNELLPLLI